MDATALAISGVCERDIDLLLLEEVLANTDFVNWFVSKALEAPGEYRLVEAHHSVTQANGESDLEMTLETEQGERIRLLVENKVNAGLQPLQAERYRNRGQDYCRQGLCGECRSVLVAPARYFGGDDELKGFDARLTYEQLKGWFEANTAMGRRTFYKTALLTAAIQKGVLGYQLIPDDPVSGFWQNYWKLVQEIAPELEMARPSQKPSGSTFITFHPPTLPSGVAILHKLCQGNADLQFSGYGLRLSELQKTFVGVLESDMMIDRASKSGVVRIRVPVLNVAGDFDEQRDTAVAGVTAAKRLLQWFQAHKGTWVNG